MEQRYDALHLYSDETVRAYAVAVYKHFDESFPDDYKGWRGDWTVYIGADLTTTGITGCVEKVRSTGDKVSEQMARALFPVLAQLMDKRKQSYRR